MSLDLQKLTTATYQRHLEWDDRDAILYALATSNAESAIEATALRFIYEPELVVLPGFATVLARNIAPTVGDLGGDYSKTVLAGVQTEFENPLPAKGQTMATSRVIAIDDRGPDKGALIALQTIIGTAEQPYATVTATVLARGDGGCGQFSTMTSSAQRPARAHDRSVTIPTRPDQALLYRLLGDRNPLHIDPATARAAGFDRPILHGLCTYGIVLRSLTGSDARIRSMGARFSSPVYPGETLRIDIWDDAATMFFEVWAVDRNARVLADGLARSH